MTIEKGRTKLLIVEGRHEVLFFEALCRARSIVGIAARAGYWDLQHPAFDALAAFVAAILE